MNTLHTAFNASATPAKEMIHLITTFLNCTSLFFEIYTGKIKTKYIPIHEIPVPRSKGLPGPVLARVLKELIPQRTCRFDCVTKSNATYLRPVETCRSV